MLALLSAPTLPTLSGLFLIHHKGYPRYQIAAAVLYWQQCLRFAPEMTCSLLSFRCWALRRHRSTPLRLHPREQRTA
jgi:hypothetical protein